MKPWKVGTVVGGRPQFIKAVAVSRAIGQHNVACPERAITDRARPKGSRPCLYGNGHAAERIVHCLMEGRTK